MIFYKKLTMYNYNENNSGVYWTFLTSSNSKTSFTGSTQFNYPEDWCPYLERGFGDSVSQGSGTSDYLGNILTNRAKHTIKGEWTFENWVQCTEKLAVTAKPIYLRNIKFIANIPVADWFKSSASDWTSNASYFEFWNTSTTFILEQKWNKEGNTQQLIQVCKDFMYVNVNNEIAFGTSNSALSYAKPLVRCYGKLEVKDTVEFSSTLKSGNYTCTGKLTVQGTADSEFSGTVKSPCFDSSGTIVASSYCQASYFNATSDKRAKENIHLSTYSAIDLIKKVQVYNYQYKNTNDRVTGIMAQDLLEAQPKELDLVSNVQATGEDGDYMSIKTDKLVSVLWKAIQEQQEQIEELKQELKMLRGGN